MEKKTQEGAPEGAEVSKRRRRYSAEELSSTAEELKAQAEALRQRIRFFRLRSDSHDEALPEVLRAPHFATKIPLTGAGPRPA